VADRLLKPKKKAKSKWMLGFFIPPRKSELELAQEESAAKVSNDFKRKFRR
jgi:hypothetical protein